ncbi:hypothetical protein BGZ60DRAFT_531849 [Tricladium varicosporioides]|nr:hypothetical protein BGZ60DRAFT_531849 [Hymenoscyphus varicosporioides]
MNHSNYEILDQPPFHDQVPGKDITGMKGGNSAQPEQNGFNPWSEFASTHLSQFPHLAWNEQALGGWLMNSYDPPLKSMPVFGDPDMDLNSANQPSQKDDMPVSKQVLAKMMRNFLAADSSAQSEPRNLHPIPVESVQTFVSPDELPVEDSNQVAASGTAEPVSASSSAVVVVHHGDGSKEMVVDLTLTAKAIFLSKTRGPRRSGPLSDESRASIKLLKEIGACWHCRFTKGQCDVQDPCERCPTTRATPWRVVGCRRGTLQDALTSVILCPKLDIEKPSEDPPDTQYSTTAAQGPNSYLLEITTYRQRLWNSSEFDSSLLETNNDHGIFTSIYRRVCAKFSNFGYDCSSSSPYSTKNTPGATPLHHRVVEVLWEAQQIPQLRNSELSCTIDIQSDLEDLLWPAALYQEKEVSYQLINKAILCLQASLEAVRVQDSNKLTRDSHRGCNALQCNIDCLARLDDSLEVYSELLSKVIFKPNSKYCREWWLSVFYSLCIQSHVRRCLVLLVSHLDVDEEMGRKKTNPPADEYLHLAVELFAACNDSGRKYDPLNYNLEELSSAESNLARKHALDLKHAELAQAAARQDLWAAKGISGSYEYLRRQFDVGSAMAESSNLRKRRRSDTTDHSSAHSCATVQSECSFQRRQKRAHIRTNSLNIDACTSDAIGLPQIRIEDPPSPTVPDDIDDLQTVQPNELRFEGDGYSPRWVRGFKREGWCGLCKPGRWIDTGTAWWNHRVLLHGICAETGKTFPDPESAVEVNAATRTWKGRCGKCKAWITFRLGDKRHYSGWYMHAGNCYDRSFVLNPTSAIVDIPKVT